MSKVSERVEELEAEIKKLLKDEFEGRPLPEYWKLGHQVRYLRTEPWGHVKGDIGVVVARQREYIKTPAADYQVFYTAPVGNDSCQWRTTPDDVELIE